MALNLSDINPYRILFGIKTSFFNEITLTKVKRNKHLKDNKEAIWRILPFFFLSLQGLFILFTIYFFIYRYIRNSDMQTRRESDHFMADFVLF